MNIAEVAKRYNLSQDTLRYYEKIDLLPSVQRNKSGIRDYSEENLRWVEFIKCMRAAGLPIEVLIEYVRLFRQGESTAPMRKQLLIEQRDTLIGKIADMQKTLDVLNRKIDRYESAVLAKERDINRILGPSVQEN